MSETGTIDADFWLLEPHVAGQTHPISGDVDGVPWAALFRADYVDRAELGWTAVIGFAVGVHADPDEQAAPFVSFTRPDDDVDVLEVTTAALIAARNALRSFEDTRRLRRAIADGVGLRGNPEPIRRPLEDELQIALAIYELVAAAGRRDSTRTIAAVTGWSESKSEKLVARLRARDRVGPARRGRPTPKPRTTKTTAKTTTKGSKR